MAGDTGIAWADKVWNPLRGCSRVSAGCMNCYAERFAMRMAGPGKAYEGLVEAGPKGPRWTGKLRFVEKDLEQPLKWRKPQRVFVNSMSDFAHPDVMYEWAVKIFAVMAVCPEHTFMILTKRPDNLRIFLDQLSLKDIAEQAERFGWWADGGAVWADVMNAALPLANVQIGVSVEDQATADERIPILLDTPAAVRWASVEPMLGPVDLARAGWDSCAECGGAGETAGHYFADDGMAPCEQCGGKGQAPGPRLDGIVCGGESGGGARWMHPSWPEALRDQAVAAGTPFFFKQWGSWKPMLYAAPGDDGKPVRIVKLAFGPREIIAELGGSEKDRINMIKVGVKAAGRVMLDGREWLQIPEVRDRGSEGRCK